MREILFKAKRLDNGEWFEGVPVDLTPIQCFAEPQKKEVLMVRAGFADWGMPRGIEGIKVDPETVCGYTGLTDKNKVKIFECDVINVRTSAYAFEAVSVEWHQEDAAWCFCCKNGSRFRMLESFAYEVIGNIHDKEAQECSV